MITTHAIHNVECLKHLRSMDTDSVDLVLTSPPYEDARALPMKRDLTEIGWSRGEFRLNGQAYVDWLYPVVVEMCRVSRGLVCIVIEGRTKRFAWSATPILLMQRLHDQQHRHKGNVLHEYDNFFEQHNFPIYLRKPLIYRRVGIPGSGGPDYLRNDYEFIIVCSKVRKLPWADPLACASPPKYDRGGNFSHQTRNGRLTNGREYPKLKLANPGNIIDCHGGGGHTGDKFAHDNEAPFPEKLADFIIRSFCPPSIDYTAIDRRANYAKHPDAFGGIVLDPFAGSGTVAKCAALAGRNSISIDIRPSQINLIRRRLRSIGGKRIGKRSSTETFQCSTIPPSNTKTSKSEITMTDNSQQALLPKKKLTRSSRLSSKTKPKSVSGNRRMRSATKRS